MKILLMSLFVSVAANARQDMPEIKRVPLAIMNYACQSKGALFYLSWEAKALWVSDPKITTEGFETENVEVRTMRCPDTFKFKGTKTFGGEKLTYLVSTHRCNANEPKIKGSAVVMDERGNEVAPAINLECKRLK